MEQLCTLFLGSNQISSLPEDFGKLKYLRFLTLRNNLLEELPKSFNPSIQTQLKHLYIAGNQIPQNKLRRMKRIWSNTKIHL